MNSSESEGMASVILEVCTRVSVFQEGRLMQLAVSYLVQYEIHQIYRQSKFVLIYKLYP